MDTDTKKQLYEKEGDYFGKIRHDIISLVPQRPHTIIDIGCGSGQTLLKLKEVGKASLIVGVDINSFDTELDNFIVGDIEQMDLPYPDEFFDIMICTDILEHLISPWDTLKRIIKYLKSDGLLLASIPNVRELHTLSLIFLKGDFRYGKAGILDKTHLRFFCKKNIIELVRQAGLEIVRLTYSTSEIRNAVNKATLGLFEEFIIDQYIVVAKKKMTTLS